MTGANFKQDFKQPGKHWCKFCKIFVYNNASCLKKHESSPQHQFNVERFIRETKKQEEIKKRFSSASEPIKKGQGSYYSTLQVAKGDKESKSDKEDKTTTSKKNEQKNVIGRFEDDTVSVEESEEERQVVSVTLPDTVTAADAKTDVHATNNLPFIQRRILLEEVEDNSLPVKRQPKVEKDCDEEADDIVVFKKKKY